MRENGGRIATRSAAGDENGRRLRRCVVDCAAWPGSAARKRPV